MDILGLESGEESCNKVESSRDNQMKLILPLCLKLAPLEVSLTVVKESGEKDMRPLNSVIHFKLVAIHPRMKGGPFIGCFEIKETSGGLSCYWTLGCILKCLLERLG
jgi:hypothetical protein